eukprot:CAMPEP_0185025476 /NCGR_PEP_ID=MMETSP1103-20130426/8414_1 /TAXON_ID=36769 /ORGANISM="Paraphysomonas bandaiensis, Strain Caron Lab Isolate" /LENGTH=662 /DNA_ID=CAMNT_0027558679 /DNA_START=268 /DNA_END=2256 /DNA_ORIENTATION=-
MDHLTDGCTWHPEYGAWMVESTPSRPYSNYVAELLRVERNMLLRRRRLLSVLKPNEIIPYVTAFPLMGTTDFIHVGSGEQVELDAPHSRSDYVPDIVINPHPRFAALTNNIRSRRGSKVDIRVPLFKDVNTPEYARSTPTSLDQEQHGFPREIPDDRPYIDMDCMAFGMGMCCLQVTFQARDVDESRYMYDQLAVLAPIMLSLTAATPIFKGRLADIDARWTVISQSVDDRSDAERGLVDDSEMRAVSDESIDLTGRGVQRLHKSRYDSISTYIYHCSGDKNCERSFEMYNDIPCEIDEPTRQTLLDAGVDMNLAHHIAHLFVRDPLVIFEDGVELDDSTHTDHFENIQSTNWQTVRWKPPPPRVKPDDPHIGWRTEFRSMELSLTDFENAAFTVFVVLITRVILAFDLALYIPLSKVDENMRRAHMINSCNTQKFFFRRFVSPPDLNDPKVAAVYNTCGSMTDPSCATAGLTEQDLTDHISTFANTNKWDAQNSFEEMSLDEIFNGKCCYFPGLLPLVYAYLDYVNCDQETFVKVDQYLKFVSDRATGRLMTTASWIRKFVTEHPDYKHDSVVSSSIAYDLMIACKEIGEGDRACPELLGSTTISKVRPEDAYGQLLSGRTSSGEERSALLRHLIQRAKARIPNQRVRGMSLSESYKPQQS